jgi:hypothetical protein
MRYKEYHVHRVLANGSEHYVVPFSPEHIEEAKVSGFPGIYNVGLVLSDGLPSLVALILVNKWNKQNVVSGFTYWIE